VRLDLVLRIRRSSLVLLRHRCSLRLETDLLQPKTVTIHTFFPLDFFQISGLIAMLAS
jgi:hypothetical protein